MDPVSLGEWLKALRLNSKISLEKLAEATKVSPRFLDALERGDPDTLPTRVHARAFALAYARACQADEDEAMRNVSEAFAAPAPAVAGEGARAHEPAAPAGGEWRARLPERGRLWAIMAVSAFALVLVFNALSSYMGSSGSIRPERAGPGAGPTALTATAAAPAPADQAEEGDELHLRARRPCWVVLEIDGKRLPTIILEREVEKRERFKVRQKAVMLAGNVGAVRIWWRGENIGYLGELGERLNGIVFEKGQPWRRDEAASLALPPGVPSQAEK